MMAVLDALCACIIYTFGLVYVAERDLPGQLAINRRMYTHIHQEAEIMHISSAEVCKD